MIITLTGEESLTIEPAPGKLTIEAETPDQPYSPFHMLGSALGACTRRCCKAGRRTRT